MVSTFAGSSVAGTQDGFRTAAQFSNPVNVVVANDGTAYVADFDFGLIRKITPAGQVSTLTNQSNFQRPFGIALSSTGALYVSTDADDAGNRSSTTGTVWSINLSTGVATVIQRDLGRPRGLAVLPNGQIILSDLVQNTISLLNPTNGTVTPIAGLAGTAGFQNGNGTGATFSRPYGVTVQSDGSLLVADQNNNCIRRVTLAGAVTTYAGTGTVGSQNGPIATATFDGPQDVKVDGAGRIYVADTTGKKVRLIVNGKVSIFAGDGDAGFRDGPAPQAEFFGLEGFFVTKGGKVFVADGNGGDDSMPYNRIRVIE